MSGFVSKISAAGSKGWTGLQSLWERDNKTTLTASDSSPPAEKTSLLSLALPSRHPRGSRLLSEEDDGVDSPPEDGKATTDTAASPSTITTQSLTPTTISLPSSSSPRSQPKVEKPVAPPAEWASFSEDEADVWLKADSAHRGILDMDKKKSTRESKRPSPRFKHKMAASTKGSDWKLGEREKGFGALGKLKGPSFGKLLDTECDEGERGGGSSSAGCENKVWADDDDDDEAQWRMIEQRAAPKSK